MESFSVRLEARAPAEVADAMVDEDAADALMDLLEEHDGIVSAGGGSWDATVSVETPGVMEAALRGALIIEKMAAEAGMPSWPLVRAEVIRCDLLEVENERPVLPDLVSAPEAAEMLSVSPQRVHELAAGHAGFPEPAYELRTGRLWLRAAIEAFAERWDRQPGRPRKVAATS